MREIPEWDYKRYNWGPWYDMEELVICKSCACLVEEYLQASLIIPVDIGSGCKLYMDDISEHKSESLFKVEVRSCSGYENEDAEEEVIKLTNDSRRSVLGKIRMVGWSTP